MAQAKKRKPLSKTKKEKTVKPLIPEKYQDYFYIAVLFVSVFIFFAGALGGGGFVVSDNIASISFRPYIDAASKSGDFPLWMPHIFGGMPGYAALLTSAERIWDFVPMLLYRSTEMIGAILGGDLGRVLSYYCIFALGMYLLMRFKDHTRFVSFFTSFAAVFSTVVITWVMIGHNTKPLVFAMFPYIFILMEKLRVKFSLLYAVLLVFAVHMMMEAGHLQMIFYGICAFGIYLIFELVSRIISKREPLSILKPAIILAAAGGLAFIMSADRYLSTMEYTSYSTRGSAPIVKTEGQSQTESGGNDYDYATMWSFSPEEIATFFVPNYFGFGKLDYEGPATNGREIKLRSYWGQKPFEDSASYMGIFVLGLALLGSIVYRKDVFVQSLIAISIFALFLSFGRNLPILYDLFYNFVPSFDKFRAPSMALALIHFSIPILAGYGLAGVLQWRKELKPEREKMLKGGIILAGIFLLIGILFSIMFKSAYIDAVASSKSVGQYPAEIHEFIWSAMISDWYVTAAIAIVAAGLLFLFAKRKIGQTPFMIMIFALLIFDLWRVGYRPMEYSDNDLESNVFRQPDVVDFVKQDNSTYRVADYASPSPNVAAYFFLENVNGYHSAKLRVYQDMLDVANQIEPGSTSNLRNELLWDIMNVKYLITDKELSYNSQLLLDMSGQQPRVKDGYVIRYQSQQTGKYVVENTNAFPRAFFVNGVRKAKQMDILKHLKKADFDPKQIAFVEEDLPDAVEPLQEGASATILEKKNEYIKIEANATGNNLLFIGEIYYPAGWEAYIDGQKTDIHKVNFGFRGVIVPRGKHIVELKFEPDSFYTGKTVSIATNVILALALIAGIFLERRKKGGRPTTQNDINNE